ncbi:hypothetical protein ACFY1J_31025 [Streptomyces sp. NPDC001406]|uniref:hypothetical protein n=1 Tax=Streptomyces sp. NPDC001406 TaxID=3364572 RepID=UPI00367D98AE
MNRSAWRAALTLVSAAAVATTGWSLYAMGRHYDAPMVIAGAAVAVFDGAAYASLHLASEASAAGRSAVGPRFAALLTAAVSVYLNITHADLIGGGTPAALFFAMPTVALLAVSEMWAGPRAAKRAELGEKPFRLPTLGGWAWTLAPRRAGRTVKSQAVDHIKRAGQAGNAAVIRLAHTAHPDMPPAELATLLAMYGFTVDTVQVALVLAHGPAEVTLERADTGDALLVSQLPAVNVAGAVLEAASALGPEASVREIADRIRDERRLIVDDPYIRTVLSRAKKQRDRAPAVQTMEGGYA